MIASATFCASRSNPSKRKFRRIARRVAILSMGPERTLLSASHVECGGHTNEAAYSRRPGKASNAVPFQQFFLAGEDRLPFGGYLHRAGAARDLAEYPGHEAAQTARREDNQPFHSSARIARAWSGVTSCV